MTISSSSSASIRRRPARITSAAIRGKVAIIGASGYTGAELLRLLIEHPHMTIAAVYAKRAAGQRIEDVFPHLRGRLSLPIEAFDADSVAACAQVAFCALPHGESAPVVAALRERGVIVIDLSADFRLNDESQWREWYASDLHPQHPAADLLDEAVYGLPERHRAALRSTGLVAVPGCYPTASILAVAPLLAAGLVRPDGIIIDAKSGASGAGRSPSLGTHLPEMGESIRPYKVAGAHRHTAEIEQELGIASAAAASNTTGAGVAANANDVNVARVLFTPHMVPMSRGILACVYAMPTDASRATVAYREAFLDAYRDEPFVDVLPEGSLPDTAHVRGSNRAQVAVVYDARAGRVLAMSAIDNLVKGASGQAVQCMNILLGWPENSGLSQVALFP